MTTTILLAAIIAGNTYITLFQENRAYVLSYIDVKLSKGLNTLKIPDVPLNIYTGSVELFTEDEKISLFSAHLEYDFKASDLVEKYIGKTVLLKEKDKPPRPYTLLASDGTYIYLQSGGGNIELIKYSDLDKLIFPDISDLTTSPTLILSINAEKPFSGQLPLAYKLHNLGWTAEYTSLLSGDALNLTGSAVITNSTDAEFKDVEITLFAGKAHFVHPSPPERVLKAKYTATETGAERAGEDFYLYRLPGKWNIKPGRTFKANFLRQKVNKVMKEYRYDSMGWGSRKVKLVVKFKNTSDDPLPPGVISMYVKGEDGRPVFVGESQLDLTPPGGKIELVYGYASDIKAERKIKSRERISKRKHRETVEVKIYNGKDKKVTVNVIEHPYGMWEIIESTHSYEKVDANTVKFPVSVKGRSSSTLTYVIEYTAY